MGVSSAAILLPGAADKLVSDRTAYFMFLRIYSGYLSDAEAAGYDYGNYAFCFVYYIFFR